MRRRKNNPILVGEAGVGKTAIVEGLALRIVNGRRARDARERRDPRSRPRPRSRRAPASRASSRTGSNQVISEVRESSKPIILFIDEAHTLIGAAGGRHRRRRQSAQAGAGARRAAHRGRHDVVASTRSTSRRIRRSSGASSSSRSRSPTRRRAQRRCPRPQGEIREAPRRARLRPGGDRGGASVAALHLGPSAPRQGRGSARHHRRAR